MSTFEFPGRWQIEVSYLVASQLTFADYGVNCRGVYIVFLFAPNSEEDGCPADQAVIEDCAANDAGAQVESCLKDMVHWACDQEGRDISGELTIVRHIKCTSSSSMSDKT